MREGITAQGGWEAACTAVGNAAQCGAASCARYPPSMHHASVSRAPARSPHRLQLMTPSLCCRLYAMGVISTKKSLVQLEQLPVAAFCRRRLAVVAVRLKMAQSIKEAATYIEQGHMRVGPGVPAHIRVFVSRCVTSGPGSCELWQLAQQLLAPALTKPNTQLMLNSFLRLVAA